MPIVAAAIVQEEPVSHRAQEMALPALLMQSVAAACALASAWPAASPTPPSQEGAIRMPTVAAAFAQGEFVNLHLLRVRETALLALLMGHVAAGNA